MTVDFNNCRHRKINQLAAILASIGLIFFTSSVACAQSDSSKPELRRFVYEEFRSFKMDIPARWISETPDFPSLIAQYTSSEEGDHTVWVNRTVAAYEDAAMRHREWQKQFFEEEEGATNIVFSEVTLDSGEAAVFDAERYIDEEDRIEYIRAYNLQEGKHIYILGLRTSNKDMFELFEQMANSVRVTAR